MADDAAPGALLVKSTLVVTGGLVVTSMAAGAAPDRFGPVHAAFSGVLFVVGTGALLWAYALGVSRSRTELINVPGLFLLARPTAPEPIRRAFHWALAVEVLAVVVAASIRPYTEVAFGILAPTFGLGMMALWGGRYGDFPERPPRSAA